jgi:hypothetical protein
VRNEFLRDAYITLIVHPIFGHVPNELLHDMTQRVWLTVPFPALKTFLVGGNVLNAQQQRARSRNMLALAQLSLVLQVSPFPTFKQGYTFVSHRVTPL